MMTQRQLRSVGIARPRGALRNRILQRSQGGQQEAHGQCGRVT